MEAWFVRLALKESEPILYCIGVVLCGGIDVASAFCAFRLGLNLLPSISSFAWFCGVQRLTLCLTQLVSIKCPVMFGAAMKAVAVASFVGRHGTIVLFMNAFYRLALGRLGHSRSSLFFHLRRAEKIHALLIFLGPAAVVLASSGWFENVCHMQYGIVRLRDNIDSRQVTTKYIVL